MKSRSESNLKNSDITTRRLESYLLDSLWRKFPNFVKYDDRNPLVESFQPYILPGVQTHPSFQSTPPVPNPPRQMDAIFSPLALPVVLHDLPQGYA